MDLDKDELARREGILVNECNGIFALHEILYIHSIIYSAGRALAAFQRFQSCRDAAETVSAAHETLSHSSALSRFFWPSGASRWKKLAAARASNLRKAFDLDDDSVLRDRRLRDALEHFDERLDYFMLTIDAGEFFPDPIVGSHKKADHQVQKFFKLVDPKEKVFVLLNEKFCFGDIICEVRRIQTVAARMMQTGRLSR